MIILVGFILVFLLGVVVGSLAQLLAKSKDADEATMNLALRLMRDLEDGEGYLLSIRKEPEKIPVGSSFGEDWMGGFSEN